MLSKQASQQPILKFSGPAVACTEKGEVSFVVRAIPKFVGHSVLPPVTEVVKMDDRSV